MKNLLEGTYTVRSLNEAEEANINEAEEVYSDSGKLQKD